MKKFFISFSLLFSISFTSIYPEEFAEFRDREKTSSLYWNPIFHCSNEFQEIFNKILQFPEVGSLLDRILQDGPISILLNDKYSLQFEGYWDPQARTIYLTKRQNTTEEVLIVTLLFELHNAARNCEKECIDYLGSTNQLCKEDYVRAIEFYEYENALSTVKILNKGIEMGILPSNCSWSLHDEFEEHYQYQKTAGHSGWLEQQYDSFFQSSHN